LAYISAAGSVGVLSTTFT